jgi:hypothetical protein
VNNKLSLLLHLNKHACAIIGITLLAQIVYLTRRFFIVIFGAYYLNVSKELILRYENCQLIHWILNGKEENVSHLLTNRSTPKTSIGVIRL